MSNLENDKNNFSESSKAGALPGSLIHLGKRHLENQKIVVIDYHSEKLDEKICNSPEETFEYRDKETVSWINIDGLHDTKSIGTICQHYGIHALTVEDVLNTNHRPKIEVFDDYIFVSCKMLGINEARTNIVSEQISFLLGPKWVLSFQETEGDVFDVLRKRLRDDKGRIRNKPSDFLLYRLLDNVVDNYFFVTDFLGESGENLEDRAMTAVEPKVLGDIQNLRKTILKVRKAIVPMREVISGLEKDESALLQELTNKYFRDIYEHIIHLNDQLDGQRDMVASIMDLYHTGVSNKMNSIMQVLTIISTIFIPLTFIAGIYGMNFENIPELKVSWGYFGIWGVMILITLGMILFFKRKKWL